MSGTLRGAGALQRILLSPWQAGRNTGRAWPTTLVFALMLAMFALGWWQLPQANAEFITGIAGAAIGCGVAAWAWIQLAFNVLLQNDPQLARTVPAHPRQLRRTLTLVAGLLSLLGVAVAAWLDIPPLPAAAIVAWICAVTVVSMRWPQLWLVFVAVFFASTAWLTPYRFRALLPIWQAAPQLLGGLLWLAALFVLRATVLAGGRRHEAAHRRLQSRASIRQGKVLVGGPLLPAALGRYTGLGLARSAYAAWLHRCLDGNAGVGSRLALGLGPLAHWTFFIAGFAGIWLLLLLLGAATGLLPHWLPGRSMYVAFYFSLAISAAISASMMHAALWATRREQYLLRLLPGTPQRAALSRWLALRLAGNVLIAAGWVMVTLLAFRAWTQTQAPMPMLAPVALGTLALTPLQIALLWRDWSSVRVPDGSAQMLPLLRSLGLVAASAAWVVWLEEPWWALFGVTGLLLLPWGAWRWRRLSSLPTALPVGRR